MALAGVAPVPSVGISDIINISISVSGSGPTREGFGEPLIAGYHTYYTDRVREYSELSELVADGFLVTDPIYLEATALKSQNPAPPNFKVGRRAIPFTQTLTMTLLSTSATDTYVTQFRTPGGSWHVITTPSTGTPSTDATTLAAAITALALSTVATAAASGAVITITMHAHVMIDVQPGPASLITFADTTADPGLATDLAAILLADGDWYCLLLDSQGKAEIAAGAAFADANGKFMVWNNSDSANMDPSSTTDIFYTEKGLSHQKSGGIQAATQFLSYSAAAWAGRLLPTDPGSENWAMKTLSGVPVDNLSTTQQHAIENKNGTVYVSYFGQPLTLFGKTSGGEYLDIPRGTDALQNDMQVGVVALQANSLKVPFTDAGIDMYRSVLEGSLARFVQSGFLSDNPAPFVSTPLASQVSGIDKTQRNLPNVKFSATLAGAINTAQVQGVLTA